MPRRYAIRYIDPDTGFLKHEEFEKYSDMTERMTELKMKGAKDVKTQPIIVERGGGP